MPPLRTGSSNGRLRLTKVAILAHSIDMTTTSWAIERALMGRRTWLRMLRRSGPVRARCGRRCSLQLAAASSHPYQFDGLLRTAAFGLSFGKKRLWGHRHAPAPLIHRRIQNGTQNRSCSSILAGTCLTRTSYRHWRPSCRFDLEQGICWTSG